MAVAHSILRIVYHLLKNGTPYQDLGADYFDRHAREKTIRHLTRRLQRLGLAVTITEVQPTSS